MVRRPGTDLGIVQHEHSEEAASLLRKQGLYLADQPREELPSISDVWELTDLDDRSLM